MTYGDFAWSDLLRPSTKTRRVERPRALFVEGDPVAWMDPGESDWTWRVSRALRAVREPIMKPHLTFTLGRGRSRRASVDDYTKPVLEEVSRHPRSVWVELKRGDRSGVKIGDLAPPFPPRIERVIEVPFTNDKDDPRAIRETLEIAPPLAGSAGIGVHLSFGRVDIGNFEFGGPVRVLFDGLAMLLGGSETSPGDVRIEDLRVTRDPGRIDGCEIRLWTIDD